MNKPTIITGWQKGLDGLYHPAHSEQSDCDCDCACENSPPMFASDPNLEGAWVAVQHAHPVFSSGAWTSIYNPLGPVAVSVMNEEGLQLLQSFETPRQVQNVQPDSLEAAKILLSVGLLRRPEQLPVLQMSQSTTLSAWLHLTNACNLRCDYCYLNKTSEGMSREVAFAALQTLFDSAQNHHYRRLKIKYAGGEPFLRFRLLQEMHNQALQLQEKYLVELEEVVISNGTLLKEDHIDFLLGHKIRLSISLDGIGKVHDQQRAHIDGRGSFAEIENTLLLCKQKGYSPDITITVTDRNAEHLAETADYLLQQGLHFNFNFYRENDCSMSFQDLKFGEEKIIQGIKRAYQVIEQTMPEWSLLGGLVDRGSFATPHTHTCSVGRDYMVIDQHGKIAKCQMTISLPVTDIYVADPLTVIRHDKAGLQNVSVDEKEGCRTCQWKYWCAGGCSLATYRATGRYDVKSLNCNIYKAIYPELLRLESLRLLRYAGVAIQ